MSLLRKPVSHRGGRAERPRDLSGPTSGRVDGMAAVVRSIQPAGVVPLDAYSLETVHDASPLTTVEHTGSAERDAVELIQTAWAGDYPNAVSTPVDPIYIAQGIGIQVYRATLDPEVSGMLVKKPGLDPEIYLNRRDSDNRQRFTCAHELGHNVKRAASDEDAWEYVDARGPTASRGTHSDEIYANRFAACSCRVRSSPGSQRKTGRPSPCPSSSGSPSRRCTTGSTTLASRRVERRRRRIG